MRIVAGRFKGATLVAPKGHLTRPTSDRVRESLFNILLQGKLDFEIEEIRVLDLFAGSGALGLEALSRGARSCLFIEQSAEARGVIRRNIEALGLTGVTKIWRRDASELGPLRKVAPFDLVFADPPYGKGLGARALTTALAGGWLVNDAICILEERSGIDLDLPDDFHSLETRTYGDTQISILECFRKSGNRFSDQKHGEIKS